MYSYSIAYQDQHQKNIKRVQSAVKNVANLDFYVCFLRFDDLWSHGKLLSHEVVRAKNQLVVLDTFSDVKTFIDNNQVAFISHQCALARPVRLPFSRPSNDPHPARAITLSRGGQITPSPSSP